MANIKLTMTGLGSMVLGVVLIIVLYGIVPVIGEEIDNAVTLDDDTSASVVVTAGRSNATETFNLSTEVYTITDTVGGAFNVGNSSTDAGTSANLTAEINANSSLFTAVNGTGTVTVTTILKGTEQNALTCSTNVTDASCAATFTGATDGTEWNPDVNSDIPTGPDFWATLSGFITLSALMLFVGGFIGVLKGIRS